MKYLLFASYLLLPLSILKCTIKKSGIYCRQRKLNDMKHIFTIYNWLCWCVFMNIVSNFRPHSAEFKRNRSTPQLFHTFSLFTMYMHYFISWLADVLSPNDQHVNILEFYQLLLLLLFCDCIRKANTRVGVVGGSSATPATLYTAITIAKHCVSHTYKPPCANTQANT